MAQAKKHNRSSSTSVVVVSKAAGKYKEIKSFCSSTSEEELETLCVKASNWISTATWIDFTILKWSVFLLHSRKTVSPCHPFIYIRNALLTGVPMVKELPYSVPSSSFQRVHRIWHCLLLILVDSLKPMCVKMVDFNTFNHCIRLISSITISA